MLSRFERALLERHLSSCESCRRFSADVRAQTARLRTAPLAMAPALAYAVPPRPAVRHRRAVGFAGALLAAATAALVSLTPNVQRHETTAAAATTPNTRLLAVVPEHPSVSAPFEIGRLRLVSPASADGAVRGYYGLPA